jgi:deazaflavin-dependent oxidoreductase (nitroreductase family)
MGLLTPLAVRIGALPWLPDHLPKIVKVDEAIQRTTRGRFTLLSLAGLPSLTLTVPGRKSGVPRSTPLLTTPVEEGWVIAGSYFGGPKTPLWVGNLRATETAQIRFKGRSRTVTWREVEGEERAQIWQRMLATWPNYALYEKKTDRLIPVFVLTPLPGR